MVCPHGEGGGVNFSRFCANVFYGLPLSLQVQFYKENITEKAY